MQIFLKKITFITKKRAKTPLSDPRAFALFFLYRERDLNPHSHHWPKDFKSFVSTDSTIAAQNRVQRYNKNCTYANPSMFFFIFYYHCRLYAESLTKKTRTTILLIYSILVVLVCDPGGIQTHDLQNRNLTLYSAKLQGLLLKLLR